MSNSLIQLPKGMVLAALAFVALASLGTDGSTAATPASGTIDDGQPTATWDGPSQAAAVTDGPDACDDPSPAFCDEYTLNVDVAPSYWDTHIGGARVEITWPLPDDDFDLYIYKGSSEVTNSAQGGTTEELAFIPNASGTYTVQVVYFLVTASGYEGTADFLSEDGAAGVIFDTTNRPDFAPATIATAHFLGAEPQITVEHKAPGAPAAAIDPNRIFVDFPQGASSNTGQLHRSVDGGDSFRQLLDLTCANRQRPNCLTSGGGDTENEVNLFTGTLFFSDQEALVQQSLSTSFDHGDSFPVTSQFPVTNETTGVDRQWVGASDDDNIQVRIDVDGNPDESGALRNIEGVLAYHVPLAGQYIQAITEDGTPVSQALPQILLVDQSGPIRIDNNPASKGYGWIYQSYRSTFSSPSGFLVGSAFGPDGDDLDSQPDFLLPENWENHLVNADVPTIFPWISIDHGGNVHAVWVTGGVMYYSFSAIDDAANDPTATIPGRPGTEWSPKVAVSLPTMSSVIFPEVIAGDDGRIAITYLGTEDPDACSTTAAGINGDDADPPCISDNVKPQALWQTYAAVITDATSDDGSAVVATGKVSHRAVHRGNICTGGTSCVTPRDRSLLDLIDLGFDNLGRVAVIFTDNNAGFHEVEGDEDGLKLSPFVHYAKQIGGPSLIAATPQVETPNRTGLRLEAGRARPDRGGDATWPNTLSADNIPGLDILRAGIFLDGDDVVVRLKLRDARATAMLDAMAEYNSVVQAPTAPPFADRLQYIVRFTTRDQIYHMSMELLPGGVRRFFGGVLDENDQEFFASGALKGAGYHTDEDFEITGRLKGNTLVLRGDASDFGLEDGTALFSVSAFATAGPLEASEDYNTGDMMRTVDASPAYDILVTEGCVGVASTIFGTDEDDTIQGTDGRDIIIGFDGDDTITAGDDNDTVCGGRGDDEIRGGPGRDRLFGNNDRDRLFGGSQGPGQKDLCDGGQPQRAPGDRADGTCETKRNIP